jgi:type IV secretory pathway VirB6-like protein
MQSTQLKNTYEIYIYTSNKHNASILQKANGDCCLEKRVAVNYKNHIKQTNTFSEQNNEFLKDKASGKYSNHIGLKEQKYLKQFIFHACIRIEKMSGILSEVQVLPYVTLITHGLARSPFAPEQQNVEV